MAPWSSSVADTWDQGVVAGTGVVGAVVFGEPRRHVVVIAHERAFLPVNSRRPAPELAPALPAVRAALRAGDERAAADFVEQLLRELNWDPEQLIWTDPLAPLAQLCWSPEVGSHRDYRRTIRTGELGAEISWAGDGGSMGLRVHASHGDEHVDLELWTDSPVSGILTLEPVGDHRASAATVETIDYSHSVELAISVTAAELTAAVTAGDPDHPAAITAQVAVSAPHELRVEGGGWRVELAAGESLSLRIRVGTDAPGPGVIHRESPNSLSSSRLTLSDASDLDHVEDVWRSARSGDPAAESEAIQIAYAAGRRNIIASTGALPPTLQGVWQGTWSPAWSADYTMNGNLQLGALAGALWTGTPSLMRSMFQMVLQYTEDYRANARAIFDAPGLMLPARLSTHGHANHFIREYPHQFWIGPGNWLIRMAADYILVTGDRSILDEWLWDYTVEILRFGLAVLDAGGGHLAPSYSPENTPAGRENPLAVDATGDVAALRDALRMGSWLARLKGEAGLAATWESSRADLPRYRVAHDGALAEWGLGWDEHLEHRHVSQLHGLWYEVDEAFDDPALHRAALETVHAKIAWRAEAPSGPPGHMEMAFGLSSLGLAAAALGDAESAYQCALWLARDHFTDALVSTHDAGAIFNLDASGALPAVIASMLVGSTRSVVRLLPALPRRWQSGSVTGLTGRGGLIVHELAWSPDGLTCDLELLDSAAWLRDESTRVILPHPGRVTSGAPVLQIAPDSIDIASTARRFEFSCEYITT
jgi:hypothetical protein